MNIKKSEGVTRTEERLSALCNKTFLKLWSYPNPFKEDRKELCDLIAVFSDHVFIFFDRESRKLEGAINDIHVAWRRWKKEAVEKQINTAREAERYVRSCRPIYLYKRCEVPFPLEITNETKIHKIIVAHGASKACKEFSDDNIYGSLAISYSHNSYSFPFPSPFILDRDDPVHVLDSHNLSILFDELDTFFDFVSYLTEKERALKRYELLIYCGEEDLIAYYFLNYDSKQNSYRIGTDDEDCIGVQIREGEWKDFSESDVYARRKETNKVSSFWDKLIQRTCQNALDGTLLGDADLFKGKSALLEMAKEPRFSRRYLSEYIIKVIENFPETGEKIVRQPFFMSSPFYQDKGYVFLQLKHSGITDYDNDYRPIRREMLRIACGVIKNKLPHLNKVIGIAVNSPKYSRVDGEDFCLLECHNWTKEREDHFHSENIGFKFFQTKRIHEISQNVSDFPVGSLN